MPFNIMDLFGPEALNRLLQPAPNAQGMQNFLTNPAGAQSFNADRFGGGGQAPAQGFQELIARLAGPSAAQAAPAPAPPEMQQPAPPQAPPPQAAQAAPTVVPPLPPPVNVGPPPQVAPPRPDPMTTAAVAPSPQPSGALSAPKQPSEPFFNEERKAMLNDFFTGLAMGGTPSESIAMGAKMVAANKGTRKNVNETVAWLQGKGMDQQQARMLASSPPALNEYLKSISAGQDPQKALELQKTQLEINKLRQGRPENFSTLSADEKTQLGLDPSKAYQRGADNKISEIGGNGVNVNVEAPKLPSGYRFIDTTNPNAGVEPIPGGPATQIPGELAARIGMGENFLKNDLPILRREVEAGTATGPIDRGMAWAGYGKPAEVQRKFQSGVEVLSRLLSGAGMTQVEIDEKAGRYMPSLTDTPESVKTKLDQLEAEIKAAGSAAMRGRGGQISDGSAPPAGPSAGGVVDYRDYFKGGQ